MTRAYVTEFYNFSLPYQTGYHQLYYDYFLYSLGLWHDLVDTVYILDLNWEFTPKQKERAWAIKKNVEFLTSPIQAVHGVQLAYFTPKLTEDRILFADNDCFFYDRKGVKLWFDALQGHDAAVIFNNRGGLQEPIWKKYKKMLQMKAQNFSLNHFALSKEFLSTLIAEDWDDVIQYAPGTYLKELDYMTKEGDWHEGHAGIIYKLLDRDNFAALSFEPNQGFHHLHSVSWAYLLLTYKAVGEMDRYWEFIKSQPVAKQLKIMNWFLTIDREGKYTTEIKSVIADILCNNVYSYQEGNE